MEADKKCLDSGPGSRLQDGIETGGETMTRINIGAAAKAAGVGVDTIRY